MKLFIASDIHGAAPACQALMDRIDAELPDRILLLGDLLYHGPRNDLPEGYAPKAVIPMLNRLAPQILAVRGNCEAEVDQMVLAFPCMADSVTVLLPDGVTLFATHGHRFSPSSLPPLPPRCAFLSGHTHVKDLRLHNGILFMNPGSVSIPKDGTPSYGLWEDGVFRLCRLNGEVLAERTF